MREADIFTYSAVGLFVNALVDDALNGHIFDYVFNWKVKGNAVLVVLHQFCLIVRDEEPLLEK